MTQAYLQNYFHTPFEEVMLKINLTWHEHMATLKVRSLNSYIDLGNIFPPPICIPFIFLREAQSRVLL